jgi:hypothetical protein
MVGREAEGFVGEVEIGFAGGVMLAWCAIIEGCTREGCVRARLSIGRKSGDDLMRWHCIARGRHCRRKTYRVDHQKVLPELL